MYIVWDCVIHIEYFVFSCVGKVPSIDSTCFPRTWGLLGIFFFLLSTDSMYSCVPGDQGGQFFLDKDLFGGHFMYKLVYYNLYHVSDFTQNSM
jgi:hypothetical protein